MTHFRLFQTQSVCRQQFQPWWKWQKVHQMGRKHCGKRRNCLLRAISPFPTMFSEDLNCRHIIKGLKVLKVAQMERPWYFGTDRWSSPLYMTILLLCNWDSFGKQSWKKEKLIFFTQGFLPIQLKFNGSSHIWLVFSYLTSLQFSWANAVTCNWQLPTELDLFIFRVDI